MAKAYWQSAKSNEKYRREQGGKYEVLDRISVIFELCSFWIINFSMQQQWGKTKAKNHSKFENPWFFNFK